MKLACAHSLRYAVVSGSAEQHSHTEMLRVCQLASMFLTTTSSAIMFCRDSPAKSTSSVPVRV